MTLRYCILLLFMAYLVNVPAQTYQWAKNIGNAQDGESLSGMVADAMGNTISIGYFRNTVDFDPGPGVFNLTGSNNYLALFILKLDAAGNFVWAKGVVGTFNVKGYSIALDPNGNVLICGTFLGSVDFDPGQGSFWETASTNNDPFILKLDPNGNFLWVRHIESYWDDDFAYALTTDNAGNVYTTGRQSNTTDYDFGTGTSLLYGIDNLYVLKLNPAGNYVWVKGFGTDGVKDIYGIKTDANGNVIMTGAYNENFDTDPGIGINIISAAGIQSDVFIIKLDSAGNHIWGKGIGNNGNDVGLAISVDPSGNALVTGQFAGSNMDFDPGPATAYSTTAGVEDIFVLKLDAAGNYQWHRTMGSTGSDRGYAIATDGLGNVYTTGQFNATVDFDPGFPAQNWTSAGFQDAFMQKLDPMGMYISSYRWGGTSSDICYAVAVPNLSSTFTAGNFNNTVDFDPGVGTANLTAGNYDAFVSKLDQCYPTTGSITTSSCYTYTAPDGQVYTNSGNFTAILPNSQGCDSVITIHLTILGPPQQPANLTGNTSVCPGSTNTYATLAIPNATGYVWTLPAGWSGSSGTDTLIATAGATGGVVSVNAYNACGISPARLRNVTVNAIPAQPGSINGDNDVCPGSTNTYSITPVPGATSCTWTLPAGWSGTSTTNIISVNANATGGNLSVIANNACGSSSAQSLPITIVAVPAQPGAISGNNSVCAGSENTYSIAPVSGAASYTWSLPGGWSGSSTTNSIATTAGTQGGTISVTADFASCHSIPQTLPVNIAPGPGTAFSASTNGLTASFTDLSAAAVAWAWDFGDWSTSTAQNPSHTYGLPFVFNVCLVATSANGCTDTVCQYVPVSGVVGAQDPTSFDVSVYPNPSSGMFRIATDRKVEGQVFDPLGRLVMVATYPRGENWLDLSGYADGIYFLRLTKGGSEANFRLSKVGK